MPQIFSGASVDANNYLNQDLQSVAGVVLGATAVTAFGTAPAAANVPGVNASLFSGTTAITNTGGALNVSVSGTATVQGTLTNNNAAPSTHNFGVLPALANAASPSWTEGDQVLESVDLSGRQRVRGTLTTNNAAPTADNLGVLPAVANAAAPTYTEGDQVLLSVDLTGKLRTTATGSTVTQYNDGSTPTPPIVGDAILGTDAAGVVHVIKTDASGFLEAMPAIPTLQLTSQNVINTASTGNNYVIAGLASKTIRVMAMLLQISGITGGTPTTVTLKDGTTALTGPFAFLNGSTLNLENTGAPWFICSTGAGLGFNINQSGTAQLSGTVWYTQS
jgi:hypothetical protein